MKRTAILFLGTLLSTAASAQFGKLPDAFSGSFHDVWFFDSFRGLIAGDSGRIMKTLDGGGTWLTVTSGTTLRLRKIFFRDASNGTIVGDGGKVLTTADGGNSWNAGTVPVTSALTSIAFNNTSTGIITGENGVILRTVNNGSSWNVIPPVTIEYLTDVVFTSSANAVITGGNGTLLLSSDEGLTWTPGPALTDQIISSIHFTGSSTGYLCGGLGSIFMTNDGGNTWDTLSSGVSGWLMDIACLSSGKCYACGENGVIIKSTGNVFQDVLSSTLSTLHSIRMVNADVGFSAGNSGTIVKTCPQAEITTPFSSIETKLVFQLINSGKNYTNVKWYFGDGDSSAANNPFHSYQDKGNYVVYLYSYNETDCYDVDSVHLNVVSAAPETAGKEKITFSPNPFRGSGRLGFMLASPAEVTITLFNLYGQTGLNARYHLPAGTSSISIQVQGAGVHFLRVISGDSSRVIRIISL